MLYIDRFLTLYAGDPFLAHLLNETSRFCIYKIIIVMEAGNRALPTDEAIRAIA